MSCTDSRVAFQEDPHSSSGWEPDACTPNIVNDEKAQTCSNYLALVGGFHPVSSI
jgi:hypothetical protein